MESTILTSVTDLFKSQILGQESAQLGESETSVMRGFEASSAAILGGMANKATQTGFKQQIFDLVKSPENDPTTLQGSVSGEGIGGRLLSLVFGGQRSGITDMISRSVGLRLGAASSLMSMAAPLVLGALGKRVRDGGLDVSGFSSLLQREGSGVLDKLPSGLGRMLGFSSPAPLPETVHHPYPRPTSGRWLAPTLLGLALLAGLFWLMNRNKEQTNQLADRAAGAASQTAGQVRSQADGLKNFLARKLPSGMDLSVPSGGFEDRLLTFVSDPNRPIDPKQWFEFDRLTFETGSATLSPASQEQLINLANILKSYPDTKVKIGGYTDNTGDAAANQKLSQARADMVKQELIRVGISGDRIETEGYGDQYPVADNSTEGGRARNRRIALRVTQK